MTQVFEPTSAACALCGTPAGDDSTAHTLAEDAELPSVFTPGRPCVLKAGSWSVCPPCEAWLARRTFGFLPPHLDAAISAVIVSQQLHPDTARRVRAEMESWAHRVAAELAGPVT